jgi:hypothetical protein
MINILIKKDIELSVRKWRTPGKFSRLYLISDKNYALEKSFDSNYDALWRAVPVAMMPYHLYAIVEKFPG